MGTKLVTLVGGKAAGRQMRIDDRMGNSVRVDVSSEQDHFDVAIYQIKEFVDETGRVFWIGHPAEIAPMQELLSFYVKEKTKGNYRG